MFILFPSLSMILDHHQLAYRLFNIIRHHGDIYDIKKLLYKMSRIDLNSIKYDGQSLVHLCCFYNRLDLLKLFIEHGNCDILISNRDGWLPLHIAVYLGHMDIVYYLLQY
jgi:ankyrin repeat protein